MFMSGSTSLSQSHSAVEPAVSTVSYTPMSFSSSPSVVKVSATTTTQQNSQNALINNILNASSM